MTTITSITRASLPALLLAGLCALPCCKAKEIEPSAGETERPKLLKQPSKADRKFLSVLEKLPPTDEEKQSMRWTSLGVSVESGWVIEMSERKLVIENTDASKQELAQHYLDKLLASGWEKTSFEEGDASFVHTLERDGVTLTVTGRDGKEGGATVTLGIAPPGGRD